MTFAKQMNPLLAAFFGLVLIGQSAFADENLKNCVARALGVEPSAIKGEQVEVSEMAREKMGIRNRWIFTVTGQRRSEIRVETADPNVFPLKKLEESHNQTGLRAVTTYFLEPGRKNTAIYPDQQAGKREMFFVFPDRKRDNIVLVTSIEMYPTETDDPEPRTWIYGDFSFPAAFQHQYDEIQ